jgi:hypothetical protein
MLSAVEPLRNVRRDSLNTTGQLNAYLRVAFGVVDDAARELSRSERELFRAVMVQRLMRWPV